MGCEMADFKSMYYKLFHAQARAERKFQEGLAILYTAQLQMEEMYMDAKEPVVFPEQREDDAKQNVE